MDGNLVEDEDGIYISVSTWLFSHNFGSSQSSDEELDAVVSTMEPQVSVATNQYLRVSYTRDEVTKALFNMYPLKSSDHVGLIAFLFQEYWQVVCLPVSLCVLNFVNNGILMDSFHHIHIFLIPKCSYPELMTQFRPISLSNVIYK